MTLKFILGGSGDFVLPVFDTLSDNSLVPLAIVTQPDAPRGRGRQLDEQELARRATLTGIPVFKPEKINTPLALQRLESYQADLFLTASYGQFLGSKILHLFPFGCWNIHPSLLPQYRGAAPVNWALKEGQEKTGVCLFKMVKAMDAGPLAACQKVAIDPLETADHLLNRLALIGATLSLETLPLIVSGNIVLQNQDDSQATYAPKLKKEDGKINWSLSALEIHNLIRSVHPWPGAYCFFKNQKLQVFGSSYEQEAALEKPGTLVGIDSDKITIACGQGRLQLRQLQKPGKKVLNIRDFTNGTSLNIGMLLS